MIKDIDEVDTHFQNFPTVQIQGLNSQDEHNMQPLLYLEYEDLGHMREIKVDGSGVSFYMPHHGVYRPEKSTTKLRTGFNASSPSTSGKSLNSIQFNGGLVQEDLFSIIWFASESTSMPLLQI
ncbi:DUF1758 domain-containing protein [Trichonephila clavipes]|nr:DUF1758 domain-containing protein [Trichonephila clavipes]